MKKLLLTISIFSALFSAAQNPLVKMWDKRYGGDGTDLLTCFQQTKDGGYILGGYSYCGISGDKTQVNWGMNDYWIVKIDSNGTKQWDKDFGGTNYDQLYSIQQTTDGGYILGGFSFSGISGDKSQATWGNYDYWIVKIDFNGVKQWDKDFGGTFDDELHSIKQTTDGGYLLGGLSNSGISGDKTQSTWGNYDYWVVKIDSNGIKQWDKDFGGTDMEYLYSLQQTKDGGYILGGLSRSSISGIKTQANWGGEDYWIVKIDSSGTKQWDKDFGGINGDCLFSIQQTTDGGYILGGYSASGIGGDKTQLSNGSTDYWIIKLDINGTKQWDKDFGGGGIEDDFGSVVQTSDHGYLICGESFSNISGNKTENNLGQSQGWVVKTDSLGNKDWDKTIFTDPELKVYPYALQSKEGCYSIAEGSYGGIAGYRTQFNQDTTNGSQDYWIVKFCDTLAVPVSAFTSPNTICPGSCIDFTNLSNYATSYQWTFSGASITSSTYTNPQGICYSTPGSYYVELISTNANGSDTLIISNYITVYPSPPPQAITQSGDTLFANAGATSYQWYFNANLISGATDYFYVAPSSGDYNVVATDANGCEVEAAIFNVVAEIQLAPKNYRDGNSQWGIFPNPIEDLLAVKIPDIPIGSSMNISIYNLLGERIYLAANCRLLTVDCRLLPPGIYWLEIISRDETFRTKFVKQ